MKVITPVTITDAILTSSTIAEPDTGESAWAAATSYTLGQVVIRATTHKKYENTLAGVDAGIPENTPTRWIEIGATNRWAMFDTLRNSQSIKAASPVTVVVAPGVRIDSIGLLSVEATSVTITMINAGATVYSKTVDMQTREVLDWYFYFFEPFSYSANTVMFDLPPYSAGIITISFTSNATIKCGAIIIGNQTYLGAAIHGALSDELNFSRIERQPTGESILLPRRSIPKINATTVADKNDINKIRATRKLLNAVPAVWSGLDDKAENKYFETLLLLGVYKRFEIDLNNPASVNINFEIEEI